MNGKTELALFEIEGEKLCEGHLEAKTSYCPQCIPNSGNNICWFYRELTPLVKRGELRHQFYDAMDRYIAENGMDLNIFLFTLKNFPEYRDLRPEVFR